MRKILSILIFIFCSSVYGQPGSFVIYPGSPSMVNHAHGVFQSSSGSIFLAGYGEDITGTFSLITFTKFDENGSRIFNKNIGDSAHHFMMMRMLVIDENNFILAGSKNVFGGNNTPYVVKVDSNGTVIWEKSINSTLNSYYTGVSKFQNGNLVFSGAASDSVNGDLNLIGVITDSLGNELHSFSFGEINVNETTENCVVANDGTILICGDRLINTSIVNPYVAAFDSTGNFLWELGISSHSNSGSKNLYIDQNSNLLVIGESATDSSSEFDIQLTKIDIPTATINWMKLVPGTNMSDAGFAISETIDGNYALTGYGHDSIYNSKRIVLLVSDTSGNELSKKYFGNSAINIGYDIAPSIYGGFLIAGADFVSDRQILVYQKELGINIGELKSEQFSIFPNPIQPNSILQFSDPVSQAEIYDLTGKTVFSFEKMKYFASVKIPELKTGFYFLNLVSGNKSFRKTFIVAE